jgi:heavy metal sensor kinase
MILLPRSLTGRLLFWQIAGATGILLALGLFFYGELRQIVVSSVDRTLHAKAQIFTGLMHEEHGRAELELSEIIAGEYVIPRSGHYYRVMKGKLILAASPSLADDDFAFVPNVTPSGVGATGERFFTSRGPAGEPVRVLQYHYKAFGDLFEVTLAESLTGGLAMIDTFRQFLLAALPLGILLLSLMSWWIVRKSLAPLGSFAATIETITHKNLDERIDTGKTVRELAGIARSFNDMLDRLHHVFESQKRLVADASHELKTPLAVIRTQCDVTLQKERSPAEYGEALSTIRSETRSITRLVNDLLSLARLDAGLMAATGFVPVSVRDLADHAMRLTAPLATRQEIRVTVAVDPALEVLGVRFSLEEALLNLVTNAVHYNRPGGEVRLTATLHGSEQVAIEVDDTGIGISTADRERIFERFYRAAAVRNSDGSGLGLSIVKAIIEAHGGRVLVASDPGVGSNFTILLPAAEHQTAPNHEEQENQ